MKFNILSLNQRRKTPPVTKLECTTKNIPNLFDLPLWAKTFVQKPYQASVVRGFKDYVADVETIYGNEKITISRFASS